VKVLPMSNKSALACPSVSTLAATITAPVDICPKIIKNAPWGTLQRRGLLAFITLAGSVTIKVFLAAQDRKLY
jgi:hypothetical protein